jgi:hypothetical protein
MNGTADPSYNQDALFVGAKYRASQNGSRNNAVKLAKPRGSDLFCSSAAPANKEILRRAAKKGGAMPRSVLPAIIDAPRSVAPGGIPQIRL